MAGSGKRCRSRRQAVFAVVAVSGSCSIRTGGARQGQRKVRILFRRVNRAKGRFESREKIDRRGLPPGCGTARVGAVRGGNLRRVGPHGFPRSRQNRQPDRYRWRSFRREDQNKNGLRGGVKIRNPRARKTKRSSDRKSTRLNS